jgi:hypothetical protein
MSFPGATAYFTESEGISLEAVEDDHTEEIESLEASFQVDDQQLTGQLCSVAHEDESATKTVASGPGPSNMATLDMDYNLKQASEHVIVSSTLSNYERSFVWTMTPHNLGSLYISADYGNSSSNSVLRLARPKL